MLAMRSFADNTGRNWTNFNLILASRRGTPTSEIAASNSYKHAIEINATRFEWMSVVQMLRQQPVRLGA
jgi:hypothetical protein